MRTLSFTKHLKFNVGGKVAQNCIALGDVNGDSCNELVVGISDLQGGTVIIYKGTAEKPWWEINGMGDISCLVIGDVCNQKRNSIVIFSWNGHCSVLDIFSSSNGINHTVKTTFVIPNIDNALIGDIDNNSKFELLVCHSDKAVSTYRWNERLKKFMILKRWKLNHWTGNITLHVGSDKQRMPSLMATQPGCSYAILKLDYDETELNNESDKKEDDYIGEVEYMELSSVNRLQNPNISSKIIGGIQKSSKNPSGYFALCTLDGTLKLMEGNKNLWSVQVDHPLFAMDKLDVLGDNREEVIVCAWDGWTYIVDHDRNVVRYHFQDNVQAFCAGEYWIDEGRANVPCLVYVDFHQHIFLYFDVKLPFLRVTDFIALADADDDMAAHFAKIGLTNDEEKAQFLHGLVSESDSSDGVKLIEN